MATEVYNLRQKRTYNMGFKNPQYVQELNCFLYDEKFKISRSSEHFIKAHQKGIHVNFRPELTIKIDTIKDGITIEVHYYAKIKLVMAIVAGIVTSGITAIVGAAAISVHMLEAKKLFNRVWQKIESLLDDPKPRTTGPMFIAHEEISENPAASTTSTTTTTRYEFERPA